EDTDHDRKVSKGPPQGVPHDFVFGPYKDVGVNADWNSGLFSTTLNGQREPLDQAVPDNLRSVTLAFATGQCGSESWAGLGDAKKLFKNFKALDDAGIYYIVSTGGLAGSFSCSSGSALVKFIESYYTPHMIGVDFDIEHDKAGSDLDNLMSAIKVAQDKYPNMRFSFTLATFGSKVRTKSSFNETGQRVMKHIRSSGLKDYYINLMTMDYGKTDSQVCVVVAGTCDMGQSAIAAVEALHSDYGVPYDHIEITPMNGQNDTRDEIFTLQDVDTVVDYAAQVGLGGIHFWSLDRDTHCASSTGGGSTCSSTDQRPWSFTRRFITGLKAIQKESGD